MVRVFITAGGMRRLITASLIALMLVVATPRRADAYVGQWILAAATAINAVSSAIAACYYRYGIHYCVQNFAAVMHEDNQDNRKQRSGGGGSW